jgi:hypothetical protein
MGKAQPKIGGAVRRHTWKILRDAKIGGKLRLVWDWFMASTRSDITRKIVITILVKAFKRVALASPKTKEHTGI